MPKNIISNYKFYKNISKYLENIGRLGFTNLENVHFSRIKTL